MWKWVKGRQDTGYYKMLLCSSRLLQFDAYLLKYPVDSYLPSHTDPVDGHKHYRLNIVLQQAEDGGLGICTRPIFEIGRRVRLFRSDTCVHGMTRVYKGTRYVLSFGWILKDKS